MKDWKQFKLGEVLSSANTGLDAIKRAPIVDRDTGVKCLRIQDISQNKKFYDWGFTDVNQTNYEKFKLVRNDIIVARTGATVGVNMIIGENLKSVFNNGLIRLRAKEGFNSLYIYYLLQTKRYWDHINSIAYGTTSQPNIQINQLLDFKAHFPSFKTQSSIAEVLNSLDRKIEITNQINQELYNLMNTVFNRWFIDFEYPDKNGKPYRSSGGAMEESDIGEIPKNWKVIPIGELFEMVVGGDWGKDELDDEYAEMMYVIRGTDIPTLKEGNRNKIPYRAIKPSKLSSRKLVNGDIVIEISGGSKDQPTGRTVFITNELLERLDNRAIPASFCRLIRPKNGYEHFLAVYLTKLYDDGKTWEYQNQSTGISNFQFKHFETAELLAIPDNLDIINQFRELSSDVYSQITSNENLELINLRDTLIPKILSGEIEMSLTAENK